MFFAREGRAVVCEAFDQLGKALLESSEITFHTLAPRAFERIEVEGFSGRSCRTRLAQTLLRRDSRMLGLRDALLAHELIVGMCRGRMLARAAHGACLTLLKVCGELEGDRVNPLTAKERFFLTRTLESCKLVALALGILASTGAVGFGLYEIREFFRTFLAFPLR